VDKAARESPEPLTLEQVQAERQRALDEFYDQRNAAAGRVPPGLRAAFARGCLELGLVPDAALLPSTLQMADTVTHVFGAVLKAKDWSEVEGLLRDLHVSMISTTSLNPDFEGREAGFFTPAEIMATRLGLARLMGDDNPQAFVLALNRPGPFRDALHDVASDPGEGKEHARQALTSLKNAMAGILPEDTRSLFDPANAVRERDLSLPRQRAILGEGVFAANGALGLDRLSQNLAREMPAIKQHIRGDAQRFLVKGPKGARFDNGLSEQFNKDFTRGGIFVDGRFHHPDPVTSSIGTGTSMDDFIALFPDPQTAGLLSNLAAQQLPGFLSAAMMSGVASQGTSHDFLNSTVMSIIMANEAVSQVQTDYFIETLDADKGLYRVSSLSTASTDEPASGIERYMYEVSVDVNLGAPGADPRPSPSVSNVNVDVLFRGREI
jgi:hypothetical protein